MDRCRTIRMAVITAMIPVIIAALGVTCYSQIDDLPWSIAQTIAGPHDGYGINSSPMVIDSNGDWHLVYSTSLTDDDTGMMFTAINYLNNNSADPFLLASTASYQWRVDAPSIAIDNKNGLHVTYSFWEDDSDLRSVMYTHKSAADASWSVTQTMVGQHEGYGIETSPMVFDSNGDWHLAYSTLRMENTMIVSSINYLNADSVLPTVVASEYDEIWQVSGPSIAIDKTNKLHITYSYWTEGIVTDELRSVIYTHKSEEDVSWSPPQTIVGQHQGYGVDSSPIAIDSNGDWHLVYSTFRQEPGEEPTNLSTIKYLNKNSAGPILIANMASMLWEVSAPAITIDNLGGMHLTYSYWDEENEIRSVMYTTKTLLELVGLEVNQVVQNWINNVPLVKDKKTYVRAHIQTKDNYQVIAKGKLRAFRGGTELEYSPRQSLSPISAAMNAASRRGDWNASLNFELPDTWLDGTIELRVVGGLIDCLEAAAPVANDCSVSVKFDPSPEFEVHFIGVSWQDEGRYWWDPIPGGNLFYLNELKERLKAIYPVSDVQYTWGQLHWGKSVPPDLKKLNFELWLKQFQAYLSSGILQPFYYGVLRGPDEGGVANDIPGSVACGYMPTGDTAYGRNRHAHELGHLLGRHHAANSFIDLKPGDQEKGWIRGPCGSAAEAAEIPEDFPAENINWVNGTLRATIGPMESDQNELIYGFDTHVMKTNRSKSVVDPEEHFELMSYCGSNEGLFGIWRWISDYTYANLKAELAMMLSSGPVALPLNAGPSVSYLIISGLIDLVNDTAMFSSFLTVPTEYTPPMPPPGEYTLQLKNASGIVVIEVDFQPLKMVADFPAGEEISGAFIIPVFANQDLKQAVILHNGKEITSRFASASAPTVEVIFPNGGEILTDGQTLLQWSGNDPDGDQLTYTIRYSSDGGTIWVPLAVELAEPRYEVNTNILKATHNGLISVIASDGFHSSTDQSDGYFSVPNHPPQVFINSPIGNPLFIGEQLVYLEASAQDLEDGSLSGSRIVWESDMDGVLGTGRYLRLKAIDLSEASHLITATAIDTEALSASASVQIRIVHVAPPLLVDLVLEKNGPSDPVIVGDHAVFTMVVTNTGPDKVTNALLTDNLPAGVTFASAIASQGDCTEISGIVDCIMGDITAEAAVTITLDVVASSAGSFFNTAMVTSDVTEILLANNEDTHSFTINLVPPCECDHETDGDVDGTDLGAYIANQAGINLADCAEDFGRVDCPQ